MWHGVPFACQRRPIIGVLRMCWLLPGSFDCFCCPHTSVHRPSIACLAVFLCVPTAPHPTPPMRFLSRSCVGSGHNDASGAWNALPGMGVTTARPAPQRHSRRHGGAASANTTPPAPQRHQRNTTGARTKHRAPQQRHQHPDSANSATRMAGPKTHNTRPHHRKRHRAHHTTQARTRAPADTGAQAQGPSRRYPGLKGVGAGFQAPFEGPMRGPWSLRALRAPPLVQATVNDRKLTEPTPSAAWTRASQLA